ncbi:MAG: lycopene cyclase family protein [Eudoraea sp.]|uniref:lycopene cyclase family protein n=1 Tax=Eudoraea sp. TaxID=1979955 RepID=UPI003C70E157
MIFFLFVQTDYDYIIIGAGAAGLMLADAFGSDPYFKDKTVLLIDKDAKKTNDRTWCFWEKGTGDFDKIISKSWSQIQFEGESYKANHEIAPYTYKMLRGLDFYSAYLNRIEAYKNITFSQALFTGMIDHTGHVEVITENGNYLAPQVFNSVFDYKSLYQQTKYPVLQQHFIGWFIKSEKPVFNPEKATFMDFSIPQKGNTRFMYVLPFSETEGLVEYTLFSADTLPEETYENAIKNYIKEKLKCSKYEIIEKEKGNIPMTCYNFSAKNSDNILHIGIAGGWAKPSTGYTFMSTCRKTKELVVFLKRNKPLSSFSHKDRYWYYDLLLLDILYKDNSKGRRIFESLFKGSSPQLIFKFLDEETNIKEDLEIISSCPKSYFTKALFNRLF